MAEKCSDQITFVSFTCLRCVFSDIERPCDAEPRLYDHLVREVCIMHPANVSQNLDSIMEAVRATNSRVVLVAVTWNIVMAPHKMTSRRWGKRRLFSVLLLIFVCVVLGMVVVSMQDSEGYIYADNNNDGSDDTSFSRLKNERFLLKRRNPSALTGGQYYLDTKQKREVQSFDQDAGLPREHSLDWGYDDFMKRLTIKPKCASEALLLILITSAPGNTDRRTAIRNSWCSNNAKSSVRPTQRHTKPNRLKWHCVFLVARDNGNQATNAKVLQESQQFSDILYGDYADSYKNLSFKVLAGLHWTHEWCPLEFILKTDDDCFVNIHLLPEFLLSQQVSQSELYAGNAADQEKRSQVIRDPQSKW